MGEKMKEKKKICLFASQKHFILIKDPLCSSLVFFSIPIKKNTKVRGVL
jgi:hypothetical protein